jgi:LysM repeat protein
MATTPTQLARFGAPIAFLLAVTVAILLVRTALHGAAAGVGTSTLGPVTSASRPATRAHATTPAGARTGTRAARGSYYTVQKGDTFGLIAARFGTSVAALERLNPGVSSTALQVGQRIRVE